MPSQSSASSLLRWSCAHWLKRVASVLSDVPLSVATCTLKAESWALIRVLRSARLRHVPLTWLLSPSLARATNDRPAVMFQPSDSYTCSTISISLEHISIYTRRAHPGLGPGPAAPSGQVGSSELIMHDLGSARARHRQG